MLLKDNKEFTKDIKRFKKTINEVDKKLQRIYFNDNSIILITCFTNYHLEIIKKGIQAENFLFYKNSLLTEEAKEYFLKEVIK